jgi:lambda repressor-like predicted transcriptional regulator
MNNPIPNLNNLQSTWPTLHDLDRGLAVSRLHQAGFSLRQISLELGPSESNLRHLIKATKAPASDRILARKHVISTNELVRRSDAKANLQNADKAERAKTAQALALNAGCKRICSWILSEGLSKAAGENIVTEAGVQLRYAEESNQFPKENPPSGMSMNEIITRCKPTEPMDSDQYTYAAWYGTWLFLWIYHSMPDPWVRYEAIKLALEEQNRRTTRHIWRRISNPPRFDR